MYALKTTKASHVLGMATHVSDGELDYIFTYKGHVLLTTPNRVGVWEMFYKHLIILVWLMCWWRYCMLIKRWSADPKSLSEYLRIYYQLLGTYFGQILYTC